MADYDKDEIIKDYVASGKGAYSTFHADRLDKAKKEGKAYPALMTFRKWLVDAELLEDKSKGERVEAFTASSESMVSIDRDYLEFLKSYLPESVRENPEVHFLKWQVERLKAELAQRDAEKKG